MAVIGDLYIAMLTRTHTDAGTDSAIGLIVNEQGADLVSHRFGDTAQKDQERAQANVYRLDISKQEGVAHRATWKPTRR